MLYSTEIKFYMDWNDFEYFNHNSSKINVTICFWAFKSFSYIQQINNNIVNLNNRHWRGLLQKCLRFDLWLLPKNYREKLICSVAELSKHLLISNGNFILKTEPLTLGIFVSSVKISEISIYWSSLPKPNHPNLIPDVLLVFFKNVLEN